jgi:hypothetical protein
MEFHNATDLDTHRLNHLVERHTRPFRHDGLVVRVRYSRGADFSGTCYYNDARIFINLGRHVTFPYNMATHIAKAESNQQQWWRELYRLRLADAYQLVLFVYLHELYHYLIKLSKRNPRRKEAMCDRFATRVLVDEYQVPVLTPTGARAPRHQWDFQDLSAFVAAAPKATPPAPAQRLIPVRMLTSSGEAHTAAPRQQSD